jgi:CRISPR system Cascade subunit CasE
MHAFPDEADQHSEGDWNPRQTWHILFRQEPDSAVILVQSDIEPNWSILPQGYLDDRVDKPVDQKPFVLTSEVLERHQIFQFRLKANPSKRDKKTGKTVGFLKPEDQLNWLEKQGDRSGFKPHNVMVIPAPDIFGKKQGARPIQIKTVLYQGLLEVTDSILFLSALQQGIGRGKSYGCGLLSIAKYG